MGRCVFGRAELLVAITVLCLTSVVRTVSAQECRPARLDSGVVWGWVDSLAHLSHHARVADVAYRAVAIPSRHDCSTAVEITWSGGSEGAVAVLRPDGRLGTLDPDYPFLKDVRPAGLDRIAFSYRRGAGSAYGLGVGDYHFIVLCSFGTPHWAECLDLDDDVDYNSAPEWIASDSSVGLYTKRRNDIQFDGDYVVVHRYVDWLVIYAGGRLGDSQTIDVGSVRLRLP